MAKAKVDLKCTKCGKEFIIEKNGIKPKDVANWEVYMQRQGGTCRECYAAEKQDERDNEKAAKYEKAYAHAKEKGFADLIGSEKQVNWAVTIRYDLMMDIVQLIRSGKMTFKGRAPSDGDVKFYNLAVIDYIKTETNAKVYIDGRNDDPQKWVDKMVLRYEEKEHKAAAEDAMDEKTKGGNTMEKIRTKMTVYFTYDADGRTVTAGQGFYTLLDDPHEITLDEARGKVANCKNGLTEMKIEYIEIESIKFDLSKYREYDKDGRPVRPDFDDEYDAHPPIGRVKTATYNVKCDRLRIFESSDIIYENENGKILEGSIARNAYEDTYGTTIYA